MERYSKIEEWALSTIAFRPDKENLFSLRTLKQAYASGFGWYLVSADRIYKRGKEIEEQVLQETQDAEKAWEDAEPFYNTASFKGNADAWYRRAEKSLERYSPEIAYADFLTKAANLGNEQAIHDYVYHYDEFCLKMITKDAYRKKMKQEKTLFRCCKKLADKGNLEAQWKLADCYYFGMGVKKDQKTAIDLMKDVLRRGDFDDEEKALRQSIIEALSDDPVDVSWIKAFIRWKRGS